MFLAQSAHLLGGNGICQRTSCHPGNQDLFVGIQQLRGLSHEIDRAKNDRFGGMLCRHTTQAIRVTDVVANSVHDIGSLIGMSQNDGFVLLLESIDLQRSRCNEFAVLHLPTELVKLPVETPSLRFQFG